jgi:hypothetical protein
VAKKNGTGVVVDDGEAVDTGWKSEYNGNGVGGKVASVPGSVRINPGGMTLCSGTKVATVGSPTVTVTDQNCISVIVKGAMLIVVVLV